MTNALEPESLQIGPANIRWTDASSRSERRPRSSLASSFGPLGPSAPEDADLSSGPRRTSWMYVRQVHGTNVVVASDMSRVGEAADAIVTATPGFPIGIRTADCAPIALVSLEGVVGAVHAGWKGLRDGVVVRAAESMRELGATDIQAALGPCIHPECYEFGPTELDGFVDHWGAAVQGETTEGTPAFDLPAAVEVECKRAGIALVYKSDACTGCSGQHFSYRKLQSEERQLMLVELTSGQLTSSESIWSEATGGALR